MDIREFIEGTIGELVGRICNVEKKAMEIFNEFEYETTLKVIEQRFGPIKGNHVAFTKILGNIDVREQPKREMIEAEKQPREMSIREVWRLENKTTGDLLNYMKNHIYESRKAIFIKQKKIQRSLI
jgi:hypothetical protein